MLSLRNLHAFSKYGWKPVRNEPLDMQAIITMYNYEGFKTSPNHKNNSSFLCMFEQLEKTFRKNNPGSDSLGKYFENVSSSHILYADFKKRYNSWNKFDESVAVTQVFDCPYCRCQLRSSANLEKHKNSCQSQQKNVRKRFMLKKVKSIIKRSSLDIKSKIKSKPRFHLKMDDNLKVRLQRNLVALGSSLKHHIPKKEKKLILRNYACTKCTDKFVSAQTLEIHMRFDHRPRPTCSICQQMFDCRRKLTEHVAVCTGKHDNLIKQNLGAIDVLASTKIFTCNKCENFFTNQDRLREHKLIANKRMPISMETNAVVGVETNSGENLSPSSAEEKFDFKVCVKNEPSVGLIAKSDSYEDNVCPYCHKEMQNDRRFNQHLMFCNAKKDFLNITKPSSIQRRYSCGMCTKKYRTATELLHHVRSSHEHIPKDVSLLVCGYCTTSFTSLKLYCKHLEFHASPNKCPKCICRYFKSAKMLKFHVQVIHKASYCASCKKSYSLSKPHSCKHRKKKEKSELPESKLTSSKYDEYGDFVCYVCANPFFHLFDLAMHLVKHHSRSYPFRCRHCSERFKFPSELSFHHSEEHADSNDYTNVISMESLWSKHSLVECFDSLCRDRLLIGRQHLECHKLEKHHNKLPILDCRNSQHVFMKINKRASTGPESVPVSIAEELVMCKASKERKFIECQHCGKFFYKESNLAIHLKFCNKLLDLKGKKCRRFHPSNTKITPASVLMKPTVEAEDQFEDVAKQTKVPAEQIEDPVKPTKELVRQIKAPAKQVKEPVKQVKEPVKQINTGGKQTKVPGKQMKESTKQRDEYHVCQFCDTEFERRALLKLHMNKCKNSNVSFCEVEESLLIQPSGPSLDTILSPNNTFSEVVENKEELITLQEIQESLIPLDVNDESLIPPTNDESLVVPSNATDVTVPSNNNSELNGNDQPKNITSEHAHRLDETLDSFAMENTIETKMKENKRNSSFDMQRFVMKQRFKNRDHPKRKRRPSNTDETSKTNSVYDTSHSLNVFQCSACHINFDTEHSFSLHVEKAHINSLSPHHNFSSQEAGSDAKTLLRQDMTASVASTPLHSSKEDVFIDISQKLFSRSNPLFEKRRRNRKQRRPLPLTRKATQKIVETSQKHLSAATNRHTATTKRLFLMTENTTLRHEVNSQHLCNIVPPSSSSSPNNILQVQPVHSAQSNHLIPSGVPTLYASRLFTPLPIPQVVLNPTYFTAPQWNRNAFDVWTEY